MSSTMLFKTLLSGDAKMLAFLNGKAPTLDAAVAKGTVIFPGSFNPLHRGHIELSKAAANVAKKSGVIFEISASHPDKGTLSEKELTKRVNQFKARNLSVVITRAPFYLDKARLFPGCQFTVGSDTFKRIVNKKYYSADASIDAMEKVLQGIRDCECRFIVAGRKNSDGVFENVEEIVDEMKKQLGAEVAGRLVRGLYIGIPEKGFRVDLSSSEIRARESKQ
eukprot:g1240.t1